MAKFPTRESTGTTLMDTFRTMVRREEEPDVVELPGAVTQEDIENVLGNWESTVAAQLGKKVPFKRHREFTPDGFYRYVTQNKKADAVAVIEDGIYHATAIVNRARFGLRASSPSLTVSGTISLPPGTKKG
jgi:hypothetical protein